jgi:uncharacterized protein (DUF427 family)
VTITGETLLARTDRAIRARDTGSPPTLYLPPDSVERSLLEPSQQRILCEWKGEAEYFQI